MGHDALSYSSYMLVIDEDKAKQDIDMAREFIEKVEEYLKGFLNRKTQEV